MKGYGSGIKQQVKTGTRGTVPPCKRLQMVLIAAVQIQVCPAFYAVKPFPVRVIVAIFFTIR